MSKGIRVGQGFMVGFDTFRKGEKVVANREINRRYGKITIPQGTIGVILNRWGNAPDEYYDVDFQGIDTPRITRYDIDEFSEIG